MSRDLAANTAAQYAANHVNPIIFVKLEFDTGAPNSTGTIRLHNGLGTYVWDDGSGNQQWYGTGDLGQISAIEEGDEISPYSIELTLSGIDSQIAAEAARETYYQRPVTLYIGALNASDTLVATPDVIWTGFIDTMDAVLGGGDGDAIRVTAESELAMFERSSNYLYTNAQQQHDSPIGPDSNNPQPDTFFTHLQEMEDLTLDWGKRKAGSGSGGTPARTDETDNGAPGTSTR
tara:strand:+ start:561 stop:1259 length:699 start_codon:yes stop_codon:yes gene_type:complete